MRRYIAFSHCPSHCPLSSLSLPVSLPVCFISLPNTQPATAKCGPVNQSISQSINQSIKTLKELLRRQTRVEREHDGPVDRLDLREEELLVFLVRDGYITALELVVRLLGRRRAPHFFN